MPQVQHVASWPLTVSQIQHGSCCGDSRSYRAPTMKDYESSRTKTRMRNKTKDNQKALFSAVEFWKDEPLYKCRSSFYREADWLFTFREHPCVKRIKTECARLFPGSLQSGLHVIGASWYHAANRGAFLALITCACREKTFNLLESPLSPGTFRHLKQGIHIQTWNRQVLGTTKPPSESQAETAWVNKIRS
jgi:hypothetical protein